MSFQTRVFDDRTFHAIGYGCMGLSVAYGAAGTDEERLKVQNSQSFLPRRDSLTLFRTKGSRCCLRVRKYLLGHR